MKKVLSICIMLIMASPLLAQAPLGFNYQGIAREADGVPISSKEIAVRVSIIDGPQGSNQFTEEHFLTTNEFGLFTAVIGQGSGNSTLNSVDWSQGNLWLQIEFDPDNSGYILMGSQQLMSVPYALFAQQSGSNISAGYGIDITNGTISNVFPDRPVSITGTGEVNVTGAYPNFSIAGVTSADDDPSNEIQDLQLAGNILTVTNNGTATTIDLSPYLDNTDNQNLANVLSSGNSAGNTKIVDLADPVDPTDAVNLQFLEAKDATDYAINASVSYSSAGAGDIALDLSGASLDKGNLISGSLITIAEDGVYAISVQGLSTLGTNIDISINGVASPVLRGGNNYLGNYLFDLVTSDEIEIIVKFTGIDNVILQISGYKI